MITKWCIITITLGGIVRRHGDKNVLSAYTGKTAEAFVKEFAAPVETETNGVYGFIVKIIVKEDEYLLLTYRDIPYSDPVSATRERDMNRDLMKKFFDFDDFAYFSSHVMIDKLIFLKGGCYYER